jgi:hypothetical protein
MSLDGPHLIEFAPVDQKFLFEGGVEPAALQRAPHLLAETMINAPALNTPIFMRAYIVSKTSGLWFLRLRSG